MKNKQLAACCPISVPSFSSKRAVKFPPPFYIFFLFLLGFTSKGNATTYYLTAAGAANAQVPSGWNTNPAGGGTSASNFTTDDDHFIIPSNINGIATASWTFGQPGTSGADLSLTVHGTLTLNSGVVLTLAQKNSHNTTVIISSGGAIILAGTTGTNQIVGQKNGNASGTNSFTLAAGAQLKTANPNGITGANAAINTSNISASLATGTSFEFNGGTQAITGLPAVLANLTVSGSGTKTMSSNCDITGVLTVSGSAVLDADGAANNLVFTLKSSASGTARVAAGNNAGGYITGAVTVERYIADAGHRAWHLLSGKLVNGSQTIYNAWQEGGGAIAASKGTLITSNLYNGSNGFEAGSNSASILTHNQGGLSGPSWNYNLTNTNSTILSSNQGYMLFVRGDRNYTPANGPAYNTTVLRTTGNLNQGTQSAVTVSATGTGRTLVGNPFASPVDFESIYTTPNLDPNFYIWDPVLAGASGVGGFRLVERIAVDDYEATPSISFSADNTLRYIHSGQAFFLKATGAAASVVFDENAKAASTAVVNPFVNSNTDGQLLVNLLNLDDNKATALADGLRVRFNDGYSSSAADDVQKIGNFSETIAAWHDGKKWVVDRRPFPAQADTIFLRLGGLQVRDYSLQLVSRNLFLPGLTARLEDTWLQTSQPLDLSGQNTILAFSVTADALSANPDRFRIVFAKLAATPQFTAIKAVEKEGAVQLSWTVINGSSIKNFIVERAADGLQYTELVTVAATGIPDSRADFTAADQTPPYGINYYRIKAVTIAGKTIYSDPAKITRIQPGSGISIYPNPVQNNLIGLEFLSMPPGTYQVQVRNSSGQLLFTIQLQHMEGRATEQVRPPVSLTPGQYFAEITGSDNRKLVKAFMVIR